MELSLSLQHRWRRWCISLVCVFVALQLTNVSDLVSPNHVGSNNNNFTKATIASPVRSSRATTDAHFMPGHRYSICTGFFPSAHPRGGGWNSVWRDEFNATILCWTDSIEGFGWSNLVLADINSDGALAVLGFKLCSSVHFNLKS